MKKKVILFLLLLPALLLTLTGCTKEKEPVKKEEMKKISLSDSTFGYKTVFKYDKKEKYSEVKEETGGASTEISFENEDLDVEFQMYYTKMSKTSYDKTQEIRSAQKYYKEYTFGKYKAYAYGESSSGINLNILLDVDSTETAKLIFVAIDRLDTNEDVVVADVLDKDLKAFFNSIEVNSLG